MNKLSCSFLLIIFILLLPACNLPSKTEPTSSDSAIRTSVAETVLAQAIAPVTQTPEPSENERTTSPSDTPEPSATETTAPSSTNTIEPSTTPSITPSPTEGVPKVSVSVNTNCRTGPGQAYDLIGMLLVGESANVVARSDTGTYVVIENPDKSGTCWLWLQYATITGDTSSLPVMTPPPSPTPSPTITPALTFLVKYDNFHSCGGTEFMTFYIGNTGSMNFESAEVAIVEISSLTSLFDGFTDVPFVGTATGCPPELTSLGPGGVAYIAVPIGPSPAPPPNPGAHAATINICTGDGLTGLCLLKELSFTIP